MKARCMCLGQDAGMPAAIVTILIYLQEEGSLVEPHIVKDIGHKITGDSNQSDEMPFARRFAWERSDAAYRPS
jgi:hypothetical protein